MIPLRTLGFAAALAAGAQSPGSAPASRAAASRPAPADVSGLLAPLVVQHGVPALAAALVDERGLLAEGAAGVRARGSQEKVAPADPFHLGSCTKAMSATLIARLVEEGTLSFETTIGEVFSPTVAALHPSWRPVTLAQLLTHRGGAPANPNQGDLWGRLWRFDGTPSEARALLAREVLASPPAIAPGGDYLYSNAGYALAGAMAEAVTKIPYEELLRARLFAPLGMASAGFGAPGTAARVDAPRGHRQGKPVPPGRDADNPAAIAPAGRVHASVEDWGKFVSAHLRAGADPKETGLPALLAPATFARLHEPVRGRGADYAMGWVVAARGWSKGPVLTHSGSNTMWYCVVWAAPRERFAALVACNEAGPAAERACDAAAAALLARAPK